MIARRLPHVASPTASLMALIMAYKDITLPSLAPILSLAPPILISCFQPLTIVFDGTPGELPLVFNFGDEDKEDEEGSTWTLYPPFGSRWTWPGGGSANGRANGAVDLGPVPAAADERPAWAATAEVHFQAIKVNIAAFYAGGEGGSGASHGRN